jgi:hypothetical protein
MMALLDMIQELLQKMSQNINIACYPFFKAYLLIGMSGEIGNA